VAVGFNNVVATNLNGSNKIKFQNKKPFVMYNAILFKNTPDLTNYGLRKFNMIYENSLLDNNSADKYNRNVRLINPKKFRQMATKAQQDADVPVCLDIESWKLTDQDSKSSIPKYLSALSLYREYHPEAKVGLYAHTKFDELNKVSDIFYPSFYTYNNDSVKWKEKTIKEIERLRKLDSSKPIYAFIWPQYIQNPSARQLGYTFVNADFWKFQLETLYKYADGIVIWSHYRGRNKELIYFNENMPWWQVTKEFTRKNNIK